MKNEDILAIRAVPNPVKLGYKAMAAIALDVEIPKLSQVTEKLVENPNISYLSTTFGKFDVILFAEYRDYETLYKLVREEIPSIPGIKTIETIIISDMKKRYQGPPDSKTISNKPYLVDEIDEEIIQELKIDGRASFTEIANKIGISSATVSRRVANLVKKGIIEITVVANPTKLGHHVVAFLGLQVMPGKINDVFSKLADYPHFPLLMTLMNGYNILAVASVPDLDELLKFITDQIALIEGVSNIETLIRAEFKKRTYLGFDLEEMISRYISNNRESIPSKKYVSVKA
jgi:DNA-binding Lrp family transcriptional regulator